MESHLITITKTTYPLILPKTEMSLCFNIHILKSRVGDQWLMHPPECLDWKAGVYMRTQGQMISQNMCNPDYGGERRFRNGTLR
jgi:hypothetical protein